MTGPTVLAWVFLAAAVVLEVGGTMSLRAATHASRWWYLGVGLCYAGAFVLLTLALANSMPLGVAYGVWAASGVALTAVLSRLIFKEPLTLMMTVGIVMICGGVLLIEQGAVHA
ncbi:cation transporter [Zhihengliuella salsuginis]|uniref:Cation transporter n=1 Tax=Zhihengliuella salsuginis TaxID=578222 RepID=A0ABQ3GGV5_9MICC|nr:cation transporter [Zhihengliuella salsuginis]